MARRIISFDTSPATWKPRGYRGRLGVRNITYYLPSISIRSILQLSAAILILTVCTAIMYGSYLLSSLVDNRAQEHKHFSKEIDEVLIPVEAKVELLYDKVQELEAHKSFIYYKYPKQRPRVTIMNRR